MSAIANLNLLVPIVEVDSEGNTTGQATPYLEDYLYNLINVLGGEGADPLSDTPIEIFTLASKLAAEQAKIKQLERDSEIPLLARLAALEKRVKEMERDDEISVLARMHQAEKRINDLEVVQ